jgi:alpha-glucosidase
MMADGDLLMFCRERAGERLLVALNMGSEPLAMSFPKERLSGHVLLSSFGDREKEQIRGTIALRPHEGLLAVVDQTV